MSRKIKYLLMTSTLLSLLILTGCWDRVELENRAFVMVVGIDKYEPEKTKVEAEQQAEREKDRVLKVTYLLPKFSAVKNYEEGVESRQLLTSVGRTAYQATRQLTVRGDSRPFFQHMKAAVLNVDVVKDSEHFLETLDGLERQDEISRKLHLFISEDQAEDILKVESLLKPLSYKLQGMAAGNIGTNLFIPITLEEVISSTAQGSVLIPKIIANKAEIRVAGSAIIKKDKFIGWLGENDTKSVAFLTDKVKQDIVQVEHESITIPYIIRKIKVKKSARVEDGKINIDMLLTAEGDIQQYRVKAQPRLTDSKFLGKIEKNICTTMEKELNETVYKLQKEVNTDVIDIGEYLRGHHPDIWKQVEDDWEEIFPKVNINIVVDAYIAKVGSVK